MLLQTLQTDFLLLVSYQAYGQKIFPILPHWSADKSIHRRKGYKIWKDSKKWETLKIWSWVQRENNNTKTISMILSAMMMTIVIRRRENLLDRNLMILWSEVLPHSSVLLMKTPIISMQPSPPTWMFWEIRLGNRNILETIKRLMSWILVKSKTTMTADINRILPLTTRYSRWLIQSIALKQPPPKTNPLPATKTSSTK